MLRRLRGEKKSLPRDPYAIPDSPEKLIRFTKPEDPAPDFSPRRENKPRQPDGGRTKQKSKSKTLELLKERRMSQRQLAVPDVGRGELKSPQETPPRFSSSAKTVRTTRSTSKHQELASGDVEEQVAITNEDDLASSDSNGVSGVDGEEISLGTNSSHASPQGPLRRGPGRPLGSSNKKGPGRPIKRKVKQAKVTKKLIPQIPRISQIDFPDAGQRNALEDTVVGDESEVEQERTRKRKAPPTSSQQTSNPRNRAQRVEGRGAKVDRQSEAPEVDHSEDSEDTGHDVEEDDKVGKLRFFGQGWRLDEIHKNLSKVGLSHRNGQFHRAHIDQDDEDCKAIHTLCKKARDNLVLLQDRADIDESLSDPPEELQAVSKSNAVKVKPSASPNPYQIERGIQRLCTSDDKNKKNKASQIYFFTIPALVRLLRATVGAYENIDGNDGGRTELETISIDHLKVVMRLIATIQKMGEGALTYARPDSIHAVVKPVKHNILNPLEEVRSQLMGYLRQRKADQDKAERQAIERARAAEEERQEQIEGEQREHDDRIRASWLHLHDERRYVEPFGPAEKLRHLRMPDPPVECDQNDEQYVRVELFKRRIGPHPVYVKKALEQVWSEEEIAALEHGLREFAGARVFQEIFRVHCGRKGALNKYNVTEIVTTAADMKAHWTEEQMEEHGEVEDWVQQIPLWVNMQTVSGQENVSTE